MAIYRNVQLSFWTDNKVEDEFTPEDKYFYLYLLTNPQTNICGCYEVSYSQMTRHTGYNKETIQKLLERFDKVHHVLKFNSETKEILILHWYKYNWSKSDKVMIGIESVAKHIKSKELRDYVYAIMEMVKKGDSAIPYQYPMVTSVSDTDTDTDRPTVTDEFPESGYLTEGYYECEYELLLTCGEATRRLVIPQRTVNVPMISLLSNIEYEIRDILDGFPDEDNDFADVLELVDEHYEIKMFDDFGIPVNIEINHADDFVNMIVSARQIKCEFKYGEEQ